MFFAKRMMQVGIYYSRDGQIVCTPERLIHWARCYQRVRERGMDVPVWWSHPASFKDCAPVNWASSKRNVNIAGRVISLRSLGTGLDVVFELEDERAQQAAQTNDLSVSAVIVSEWNGLRDVISSIDFCKVPVDHSQSAFVQIWPAARDLAGMLV